ncbi:STAS domain-containing protein [Sinomonas sp. JGH33]|uniref:Anti-sigma factor antagonist n=1 Tax=Sinomonas terricola TaxID=3110330 RepID=A0ABU5TCA3_9MICC|nr:STAS domain-containing protein [Sinomonas sp. JGH33]MEA5457076.1 STAS domain-containing protein [Sinomonas sp. JGH33]
MGEEEQVRRGALGGATERWGRVLGLVADVGDRDGFSVLAVRGRLNMNSTDEFRGVVAEVLRAGRTRLLIDLQAAESVDSTGLGALIWAATRARREGGDLRLANANASVRKLLELSNVTKALPSIEQQDAGTDSTDPDPSA